MYHNILVIFGDIFGHSRNGYFFTRTFNWKPIILHSYKRYLIFKTQLLSNLKKNDGFEVPVSHNIPQAFCKYDGNCGFPIKVCELLGGRQAVSE